MPVKKYAPWAVGLLIAGALILTNTDILFSEKEQVELESGDGNSNTDSPDWVRSLELWNKRNVAALEKYSKEGGEREEGERILAELVRWNWSTGFGVNLAGVNIGDVFGRIKMPDDTVSLLEYLGSTTANSGGSLVSFAKSNLSGAKPPQANLRGISFSEATADALTWEEWMRGRGGRGLEGCNMAGVNLQGVNVHGAILKGANLSGTRLRPDFSDGILGKFDDTNLAGLSFTDVNVAGVSLRYSDLSEATISADQLLEVARSKGGSGLRGAKLPVSDFTGKDVENLTMQFSDLSKVTISEQQIKTMTSQWNGMGLYGARLPVAAQQGRGE